MIKLVDIHITFGKRPILDKANWMLGETDRVGLVGENGSGKSTLLKIMAGKQEGDRGAVEVSRGLTIGWLPQEGITHCGHTLEQEASLALGPILEMKQRIREIQAVLDRGGLDPARQEELAHEMAELMDRFCQAGGYELDSKIGRVLSGLGFSEEDRKKPVESFSGGWQMRIALAKLLLSKPDVLLLDEPTNHLDIEARTWLEDFLHNYQGACLIVSHDRYFLDVTIERIVEIERGALTDYRGNYSHYLVEKEKRVALALTAYEKQQEEIQRLTAFINKYRADKKRAGQIQSRKKRLEKMERLEAPVYSKPISFGFPPAPRGPQVLLRLEGVRKSYGAREVLHGVDLSLIRGEKLAVVGHNGAGKTTLLGIISGKLGHDQGVREESDGVSIAYFGQDAGLDFDPGDTVLQAIERDAPLDQFPRLRSLLGAFLFSGEDIDKKVSVLSGGEKSRLALARLLLRPANLLILDEPTNHLDLRAKEVLMEAFQKYTGTLIFVAHDRYFMEGLPQRVIEVKDGLLRGYPGDYSDYLLALEREAGAGPPENAGKAPAAPDRAAKPGAGEEAGNGETGESKADRIRKRKQDKARQKLKKKKRKRIKELEDLIAQTEAKIEEVETAMSAPSVRSDYLRLAELESEKNGYAAELETMIVEWERLGQELDDSEEIP